jgi:hypothetical protein
MEHMDAELPVQVQMPLFRLAPKPVDKNTYPLGMIGRDVYCLKPHKRSNPVDQRICGNADFITIKVDVHEESLQDSCSMIPFHPRSRLRC